MNKLDDKLLEKLEYALDLKFYDWQKDYILERPQILDMSITGKCTGKTTAYIIKILFSDEKPIRAYEFNEIETYADWFCITNRPERKSITYTHTFLRYLKEIYKMLLRNHIEPRKVFFSSREEDNYYREQMLINFRLNTESCPACVQKLKRRP